MDAARDHDHGTLGDMFGNALANPVEAGDAMPFGLALAIAVGVFEAPGCCERDAGDRRTHLGGADLRRVANEADESDCVLHEIDLSKLFQTVQGTIPLTEPRQFRRRAGLHRAQRGKPHSQGWCGQARAARQHGPHECGLHVLPGSGQGRV